MEDQSTDTSDLTNTEDTQTGATPVGKRGRHRSFRPRTASNPQAEVSAEETGVEPTMVEEAVAEPKPKRRRWFRRRSTAKTESAVTDEPQTEESEESEAADELEMVQFVERIPAGKRLTVAVAVAAALFVAAGAIAGMMLQPYLSDRIAASTKVQIVRTATEAITTLFTYTPENMDQLSTRSAKYLGGDLKDAYAKQVDAFAAANKQSQIHRDAQVVGAAVESLKGPNATAMVYANITYTSATTKDVPKIFLVSYRLSMEREGSNWVIVNMPWITSKDLTRLVP